MEGKTGAIRRLLAAGADANAQDYDDTTALMFAAAHGNMEALMALIGAGACLNAQDADGRTALMHAIENGHEEIAKVLREQQDVQR